MIYFSDEIDSAATGIGNVWNYYGGVFVIRLEGKCYWGIRGDDDRIGWEEIPEALYDALLAFEESQEAIR
jgi:hypothetical protein